MCAGTVVAVGRGVTLFRPGDAVVGAAFGHPMDYRHPPGFCAEYCVGSEPLFIAKPESVSFEDAAGLLGNTMTAYQATERSRAMYAEERRRLRKEESGKQGKQQQQQQQQANGDEDEDLFRGRDVTVFVPGALSATGSQAIQLFRNHYGVGRIISTVSTAKIPLVEEHLPGMVDTLIDYTTTPDLTAAVGAGTVDFAYNTLFATGGSVPPLMRREAGRTSVVMNIAGMFPGKLLHRILGVDEGHARLPAPLRWLADLVAWYDRAVRFRGLVYAVNSGNLADRADLDAVMAIIAAGKVRCVKTLVPLEDIDALRDAAQKVYAGKGGVGALVVKIA